MRPAVIQVHNAAALPYQKATNLTANTKLKGVYNLQDNWVQELHNCSKIVTKTANAACAADNSDVLASCLTSVTRHALTLLMLVYAMDNGLKRSHVRYLQLGGAIITGA